MPFYFSIFKKENLNIVNLANLINECIKKIFLNTLKIKNFRNHKSFEIDLKEQRAIVLGCNGIGKSNLLESVEFLSQLKSNRALSDKDLIKNDSDMAVVTGQIDFRDDLKLNLFRKGPKKIYVNESILKKQSEIKNKLYGFVRVTSDRGLNANLWNLSALPGKYQQLYYSILLQVTLEKINREMPGCSISVQAPISSLKSMEQSGFIIDPNGIRVMGYKL